MFVLLFFTISGQSFQILGHVFRMNPRQVVPLAKSLIWAGEKYINKLTKMEIGSFYFLKMSSILLSLELSKDLIFPQSQVREMTVNERKLFALSMGCCALCFLRNDAT